MDRYSRMIALLKVVLPLTALALLSTVFLISRGAEQEAAIPFAQKEIEERMHGQQVTGPFYAGSTASGDQILVSAETAQIGTGDGAPQALDMSATMRLAGGGEITLRSDTGVLSPNADVAQFNGHVIMTTDDGLRVETETLDAHLDQIMAEAPEPVSATSPLGQLSAGSMYIKSETQGETVHILFNNGVELVYDPSNSER